MTGKLQNFAVSALLAIGALVVIGLFGSFTAVKILLILTVWFAILGVVALGIESAAQAISGAFRKNR